MMKKIIYKIVGVALLIGSFVACDYLRTAEQDASPVISPDNKPTVTFTATPSGNTFKEGESMVYTIQTNKMLDRALTFAAHQVGGATGDADYTAETVVLQPYSTEVKMVIDFVADDFPENEEDVQFEIGIFGIAERYLIHPDVTNPINVDLKIKNQNDPEKLTIAFEWGDENVDYDIVTWSDTDDYPMTEWGDGGATGSMPEIDKSIWLSDPVGTYYVNIMDWDEPAFDYKFSIGHPDGTVQFIEGTFDRSANEYTNDPWTAWGGSYDSFRVLKVEHNGSSFTVTKL